MSAKKQISLVIKFKGGALVNNPLFKMIGGEEIDWLCPPQPFGRLKFDKTGKNVFEKVPKNYILTVEKEFAPKEFFDKIKAKWKALPELHKGKCVEEDDVAMEMNAWLATVDHFGLEAAYDQEFMNLVRNYVPEILQYAYCMPNGSGRTTDRFFQKMLYGSQGFRNLFSGFLRRHNTLTF